ncbi:PCRF domain-containing protein [Patescibacteria group bacterium]|nr:PCRF domain-containing protein [Patescibacteria group bacterium]
MLDKLLQIESHYNAIQEQLMDPDIHADQQKLIELNRKAQSLQEVYDLFQEHKKYAGQKKEAEEIMNASGEADADMMEMAKDQLNEANDKISELEAQLKVALLPKDPNDDKNIFLEIRPAAGGDEAGIFAAELLKAYMLFAQKK